MSDADASDGVKPTTSIKKMKKNAHELRLHTGLFCSLCGDSLGEPWLRFFAEDAECNTERQAQARIAEALDLLWLELPQTIYAKQHLHNTKHYHQRNRRRHAKVA